MMSAFLREEVERSQVHSNYQSERLFFKYLTRDLFPSSKVVTNKMTTAIIITFRYGLVVRIAGSHPAGPGSIPGNGNYFLF
jgi:hypothetical protein